MRAAFSSRVCALFALFATIDFFMAANERKRCRVNRPLSGPPFVSPPLRGSRHSVDHLGTCVRHSAAKDLLPVVELEGDASRLNQHPCRHSSGDRRRSASCRTTPRPPSSKPAFTIHRVNRTYADMAAHYGAFAIVRGAAFRQVWREFDGVAVGQDCALDQARR